MTGDPPARGPGRPRGRGKVPGSGRKKGTCNKDRTATVERIQKLADPIGFLMRIMNGEEIEAAVEKDSTSVMKVRPTMEQRLSAAQALAKKVAPDMKAVEMSGEIGFRHEDALKELR